jgi:hypothetical protein
MFDDVDDKDKADDDEGSTPMITKVKTMTPTTMTTKMTTTMTITTSSVRLLSSKHSPLLLA